MKIAIHQPQYMPWLGYFHKMDSVDLFILLDDVQFKKNEWQNRNRIRGPQGAQWLTIPNHYRFPQRINEVRLNNDTAWGLRHANSLQACYGRSPCYADYADRFRSFFENSWDRMDQVTGQSVRLLAEMLGVDTRIVCSSTCDFEGTSTERLVNICKRFEADVYLAGQGGRDYMDVSLFEQAGIGVEFQRFQCPFYQQHWAAGRNDFIPNLSAVDLVCNCGSASRDVLAQGGRP
jgi:hypothetical protein